MLTADLVEQLESAREECGDDKFFGVRSGKNEFFVCNWSFGLRFLDEEVLNGRHVTLLEDEADRICALSETKRDIIRHIYRRSWMDILIGTGIYQDAELVQLKEDESKIFKSHGLRVLPFETDTLRRYYVREPYFDIVEGLLDEVYPVIFRPINNPTYPDDYRPMLVQDKNGDVRGLLGTVTEENMWNPIDLTKEYQQHVETALEDILDADLPARSRFRAVSQDTRSPSSG